MFPLIAEESNVYIAEDLTSDIEALISNYPEDKVFLLSDEGAYAHCYQKIKDVKGLSKARTIIIPQGDHEKTLGTTQKVWQFLSNHGADRKSLLVNLGGGMPCDLGGFAASAFKRGIHFVNIPTTLLAQVDASIGGKTGVNFEGFKNEIGIFGEASAVLIETSFLETLDQANLTSGFAEMVKHAFIYSAKTWDNLCAFDINNPDLTKLKKLVADSILIKHHFVQNDPTEQNIRKALNFGHTFGHAFESLAMKEGRPVLHGHAVGFGMVCELYLSHIRLGFPMNQMIEVSKKLNDLFGVFEFSTDHFELLYDLMGHDKKNEDNKINFTLLKNIGEIEINTTASKDEIFDALNFYLDKGK